MPVRIIGMIGVNATSGDASLHVIEGGLSPVYWPNLPARTSLPV